MKRVQRGDILASDLFVVNNDQNTPLHLAVSRLNVECTVVFVSRVIFHLFMFQLRD